MDRNETSGTCMFWVGGGECTGEDPVQRMLKCNFPVLDINSQCLNFKNQEKTL